jgi:glyoxylase-like metal-dependent hydrolase (beta-lactamase superfamily II)/uncharacterized protein GlcG (DUF336 family)
MNTIITRVIDNSGRKDMRRIIWASVLALSASLGHAQGAPDFSKVEITANKVTDKFYTLSGQGGTIGVLLGADGVFMVDTQFAPLSDKIAAAIRQLSPQPIRYVVNTHVHGDHTGGNENFGRMGATIIAREELRRRLAQPNMQANGQPGVATAPIGLPTQTYGNRLTMHLNGEEVQLIAVPRAHTDGDTIVWYPGLDILMVGDVYRSIQYPNIDRNNGGTLQGLIDGLGLMIDRAGPNTRVIPGHGPTVDRTALTANRGMVLAVRDRVAALIAKGKSEDEVVAAKVTADFDARMQPPGASPERFLRQVYAELKATTTVAAATPSEDIETPMSAALISRADATRLAQAALKVCAARGMPASVVVTDSAGHMRAAFSDDNAKLVGIGSSGTKANSVLDFKASTRALQTRAEKDKEFAAKYGKDARYHFSPGGLPIYRNGQFVAIIAVGGARNIDEECALAAIKTLSWASTEPAAKTLYGVK